MAGAATSKPNCGKSLFTENRRAVSIHHEKRKSGFHISWW
jgi:hypothetical protein